LHCTSAPGWPEARESVHLAYTR